MLPVSAMYLYIMYNNKVKHDLKDVKVHDIIYILIISDNTIILIWFNYKCLEF